MRQLQFDIEHAELTLSSAAIRHRATKGPASPLLARSPVECSSVSEIILASDSALQPVYLLPLLEQLSKDERWLMWLADESSINRHWVSALGLDAGKVLHIHSDGDNFEHVCCKALAAGTGHLVIEWPGKLNQESLQRLELAAKKGASHALLIRRRG